MGSLSKTNVQKNRMLKSAKKHYFLLLLLLWVCQLSYSQNDQVQHRKIMLELGAFSAPSSEVWMSFGFGTTFKKHEMRVQVMFLEVYAAYSNWSKPLNVENSAGYAFALDHRYTIWSALRWTFYSHTQAQVQKIDVYDGGAIVGYPRTYIRSYPRFHLTSGLGVQFSFLKKLYLFHSVRYGISIGNFYHQKPITKKLLGDISTSLALGVKF